MISECMNPECREPLHYLRNGRVIRTVTGTDDQIQVEHFWLCGSCHRFYEFHFSHNGEVSLVSRFNGTQNEEDAAELDLTLVA